MVDESLKAHLSTALTRAGCCQHPGDNSDTLPASGKKNARTLAASTTWKMLPASVSESSTTWKMLPASVSESDPIKSGLDTLFAYTEAPHPFTNKQVDTLLDAIYTCKILDPACGSGAFPMGMLQKLVFIIHKLDPDNAKWMQLQIDKASAIPDSSSREVAIKAIEQDFADNEDDYGRKLYLIENCLYGVDIQPIAIQISKLRFFISLVTLPPRLGNRN